MERNLSIRTVAHDHYQSGHGNYTGAKQAPPGRAALLRRKAIEIRQLERMGLNIARLGAGEADAVLG